MADLSKYSDDVLFDFVGVNAEEELRKRGYKYGWYKDSSVVDVENKIVGYIYVLVGTKHFNSVLVGFTSDMQSYIDKLNNESNGNEIFHCYVLYGLTNIVTDDYAVSLFASFFLKSDGSLFANNWIKINKDKAYDILFAVACLHDYLDRLKINPFNDSYFSKDDKLPPYYVDDKVAVNDTIYVGNRIGYLFDDDKPVKYGVVVSTGGDRNGPTFNVKFDDGTEQCLSKLTFEDGYAWKVGKNNEKLESELVFPDYCVGKMLAKKDVDFAIDDDNTDLSKKIKDLEENKIGTLDS